jgi:ATP-dependent DNA ligase
MNPYTRKPRSGIMLCYPFEEKRLLKWGYPVNVQPKLDGERSRLLYVPGQGWTFLSSTEDSQNFAVPHLVEEANRLDLPLDTEFDGELYVHGWDFESIHSVVSRTTNLHEDHESVCFHIFDCVIPDCPQYLRFLRLDQLWELHPMIKAPHFRKVPTLTAMDLDEIFQIKEDYVSEGYEGIIVRKFNNLYIRRRSTEMMKFKPKQRDTYPIVGFKEEIDKNGVPKGTLGALFCSCDGETFSVGSGFTAQQRINFWSQIKASPERFLDGSLSCLVEYQHITAGSGKGRDKGVPRFPIYVDIQPTE